MATKLQLITELANTTSKELSSVNKWTDFLSSAAWQYKYSFEDQVLIYAQRPDARACADFDTWNEKLKRRINRGAKGIALLRERGADFYLDHVFDVSDTYRGMRGVDVKLWEYSDKYDDAIIETLENTFGELKVTTTLTDAIICAAHNAVEDNKADYLADLKYAKDDSFLADLDEFNIYVEFQQTAEASVAYMVMHRLGLHPEEVFDNEEFRHIVDFSSVEAISVLGNAVSEISEQALREISSTITAERKKEINQAKIFAENENQQYNVIKDENHPKFKSKMKGRITMAEITYRNENGILIPNLEAPKNELPIGKYGMMRKKFLKQNRRSIYSAMMLKGTLMEHLHEIDKTAREQVEQMMQKMALSEGVNEKLKAENPQRWTGLMNNLRHSAEEVVLKQLVLS